MCPVPHSLDYNICNVRSQNLVDTQNLYILFLSRNLLFFFFFQTEWMGFECVIDMDDFDPYFLSWNSILGQKICLEFSQWKNFPNDYLYAMLCLIPRAAINHNEGGGILNLNSSLNSMIFFASILQHWICWNIRNLMRFPKTQ